MGKERKRKPGRPRTRPDKLVAIRLDVTPDEADRVKAAADYLGVPQSTFARAAVVDGAEKILSRRKH